MAHYYACKFGLNRLRIVGDIRQKAAITTIMENVVIAIYRLRPIQLNFTQVRARVASQAVRTTNPPVA